MLLQVDEQTDFGLAEAIDRLHRIADAEQRAAVAVGPPAGQALQQVELTERGVLELVDQDVLQAIVEREREIGRLVGGAERTQRAQSDLDVVRLALRLKHDLQLGDGCGQQLEQRFEHAPLLVAVDRVGQRSQRGEVFAQPLIAAERRAACRACAP